MLHCVHPYPPHGKSSEIPRGEGVLKVKNLEAKYVAKQEFPGGEWVQNKKPSMGGGGGGGYGYFLELHIWSLVNKWQMCFQAVFSPCNLTLCPLYFPWLFLPSSPLLLMQHLRCSLSSKPLGVCLYSRLDRSPFSCPRHDYPPPEITPKKDFHLVLNISSWNSECCLLGGKWFQIWETKTFAKNQCWSVFQW